MIELPPPLLLAERPALIRPAPAALAKPAIIRPGNFPPVAAMPSRLPPVTFTHVGTIDQTSSPIGYPAGTAVGDVGIHSSTGTNSSSAPAQISTPAGWAVVASHFIGATRLTVHAKLLTAGDLATTKAGQTGSQNSRGTMDVFRPNRPMQGLLIFGVWNAASFATIDSMTVPNLGVFPGGPGVVLYASYGAGAGTLSDPSLSLVDNGETYRLTRFAVTYEIQNAAPLTSRQIRVSGSGDEKIGTVFAFSETV